MNKPYVINGETVSAENYWLYKFAVNLETLKAGANMVACEYGYWDAVAEETRAHDTRVNVTERPGQ